MLRSLTESTKTALSECIYLFKLNHVNVLKVSKVKVLIMQNGPIHIIMLYILHDWVIITDALSSILLL